MKLLIIRHGDPDYKNDTLTPKGWIEADLLSKRLEKINISKIYCSPLGRAKDTAKATLKIKNMDMEISTGCRSFTPCHLTMSSVFLYIIILSLPRTQTGLYN